VPPLAAAVDWTQVLVATAATLPACLGVVLGYLARRRRRGDDDDEVC
jgi:hypothetical protein